MFNERRIQQLEQGNGEVKGYIKLNKSINGHFKADKYYKCIKDTTVGIMYCVYEEEIIKKDSFKVMFGGINILTKTYLNFSSFIEHDWTSEEPITVK